MRKAGIMTMTTDGALYRLMSWLSPAYPVGAFSYSHGLEFAVEEQRVVDAATLTDWIATVIEQAAGRIDGALFAASWRAARDGDDEELDRLVELSLAWRATAETALESTAQGAAFMAVTRAAWPSFTLDRMAERHNGQVPLAVAVGTAAAVHEIELRPALLAYLQAFAANLVSAGVRLVPLGQTEGQRAMARLEPVVAEAANRAVAADLNNLGTATPLLDWCSMKHETQYTRLFRS